jgi:hypothetical protein
MIQLMRGVEKSTRDQYQTTHRDWQQQWEQQQWEQQQQEIRIHAAQLQTYGPQNTIVAPKSTRPTTGTRIVARSDDNDPTGLICVQCKRTYPQQ